MSILLVGVNHKSAPIEVRERLAFTDDACAAGLRSLVDGQIVREGLIVSTCNRVEVLTETANGKLSDTTERVIQFLSREDFLPRSFYETHLYTHADDQAVRHLFRVTSSLDSMVIGEPQVLGQVRRAYSIALEAGTAGRLPRDHVAAAVGEGDDRVVERRLDVRLADRDVLLDTAARATAGRCFTRRCH